MTTTTNMSLVLPDVLSTVGPTYATLLNAALTTIDSHNHSTGQGAQITPAGLNISSDLTFAQNNATNLRSARLYNNSAISLGVNDKTCLYALNNELYYVDGAGNNVQVTSSGSINIGTTSSLTLNDSAFLLQYFGDSSRKFRFSAANIPISTTRILSLADSGANDTIPTLNSTSVLKNKVLSDTTTTFGEVSDNTKALKVQLTSATTAKTMTLASAHTNDRTLTLPDATDTLVGKATTDDLTNKSFNGTTVVKAANQLRFNNSGNTFYTSLAAGANVSNYSAILPIADGSANQVLKTDGSGQWGWATAATTTGVVAANDSAVTFTNSDNRHQSCLPTTVRTYTLPTTSIPQGDTWDFDNQSLFLITVNSSGGNLVGYVYPKSSTRFVALVSTPTTAANWNPIYESITPAIVQANDAATTFVFTDNQFQISTPTAARTYKLPTTGVPAGYTFKIYNQATSAANYITLQSSGANDIVVVPPLGYVEVVSATSTPTTAANWILVNRTSDWVSYTPTLTGVGTAANVAFNARVNKNMLQVQGLWQNGTVAASLASISLPAYAVIKSSFIAVANVNTAQGQQLGFSQQDGGNAGSVLSATGSSTTVVYIGGNITSGNSLIPRLGNVCYTSSGYVSVKFEVPIV